jgi:hypothetical protein
MKSKLLALVLLAGCPLFARVHFSIGVGIGYPGYGYYYAPPPAPVVTYVPAPYVVRPGYAWINGYWYPGRARYYWRPAHWARRPYVRARWVAPRYVGHRYYYGYWRR